MVGGNQKKGGARAVVEAAYRLDVAPEAWLRGALEAAWPFPVGRMMEAAGGATHNAALETLKRAARTIDRAGRLLRQQDPDLALRSWEALVAGRWSLLAAFDDGGRRVLLAQVNEPGSPGSARLSHRERQVAAYLLLGHAHKLIAYELGLTLGTISRLVGRIRGKVGARSRAELLQRLRGLPSERSGGGQQSP